MEWQEILIGKESWSFLGEIALRTFIMLVLLFLGLRNKKIFHLGQIESAIFETSGEISLLLYDKKRVKPGLPIWPHKLRENFEVIPEKGLYACTYCGHTDEIDAGSTCLCPHCRKNKSWVKAVAYG